MIGLLGDGVMMVVAVMVGLWGGLLLGYARPLIARWREPVFRYPLLVLESDDWGGGPLHQADALADILRLLRGITDGTGRHPVMTLGMVFEVPDTGRLSAEGATMYRARRLDHECFRDLRDLIGAGVEAGIFVPQLHGQCHYWPAALMRAAQADPHVSAWLTQTGLPSTESLPSPLQSRWIDASQLPSRSLDGVEINAAIADEAESFRAQFGVSPRVAVATTFIWNDAVESAWRKVGVDAIITPGHRATCRDAAGRPAGIDRTMLTGNLSAARQCYLVRDVYFEPVLGHLPQRLFDGLEERTRQGRACLVEIHRRNFLEQPVHSLDALGAAIKGSLTRWPGLRFVSPVELADAIRDSNREFLETARGARVRAWCARLIEIPRFYRLARATGLIYPLTFLGRVL